MNAKINVAITEIMNAGIIPINIPVPLFVKPDWKARTV